MKTLPVLLSVIAALAVVSSGNDCVVNDSLGAINISNVLQIVDSSFSSAYQQGGQEWRTVCIRNCRKLSQTHFVSLTLHASGGGLYFLIVNSSIGNITILPSHEDKRMANVVIEVQHCTFTNGSMVLNGGEDGVARNNTIRNISVHVLDTNVSLVAPRGYGKIPSAWLVLMAYRAWQVTDINFTVLRTHVSVWCGAVRCNYPGGVALVLKELEGQFGDLANISVVWRGGTFLSRWVGLSISEEILDNYAEKVGSSAAVMILGFGNHHRTISWFAVAVDGLVIHSETSSVNTVVYVDDIHLDQVQIALTNINATLRTWGSVEKNTSGRSSALFVAANIDTYLIGLAMVLQNATVAIDTVAGNELPLQLSSPSHLSYIFAGAAYLQQILTKSECILEAGDVCASSSNAPAILVRNVSVRVNVSRGVFRAFMQRMVFAVVYLRTSLNDTASQPYAPKRVEIVNSTLTADIRCPSLCPSEREIMLPNVPIANLPNVPLMSDRGYFTCVAAAIILDTPCSGWIVHCSKVSVALSLPNASILCPSSFRAERHASVVFVFSSVREIMSGSLRWCLFHQTNKYIAVVCKRYLLHMTLLLVSLKVRLRTIGHRYGALMPATR